MKRKVILINTGSPDSSKVKDVRTYLIEFLTDPNVIDIPTIPRYMLVYAIIAPFRAFRSAKLYKKLETDKGFPLVYHTDDLAKKIKPLLDDHTDISFAMRYGKPSLKDAIQSIKDQDYDEILFIPMYPQFASSTTGSNIRFLQRELRDVNQKTKFKILPDFHMHSSFIELWQKKISSYNLQEFDALLFSFHGVPIRQTESAHPGKSCASLRCTDEYNEKNRYCYQAACYQTARAISEDLDMDQNKVHVSFQSRFGSKWLSPFTDRVIENLAGEGKKKILVVSPAFVADCLETTVEIGDEYQSLFARHGGGELTLVPSLNSDSDWAAYLAGLINGKNGEFLDIMGVDEKRGINYFG